MSGELNGVGGCSDLIFECLLDEGLWQHVSTGGHNTGEFWVFLDFDGEADPVPGVLGHGMARREVPRAEDAVDVLLDLLESVGKVGLHHERLVGHGAQLRGSALHLDLADEDPLLRLGRVAGAAQGRHAAPMADGETEGSP